MALAVVLVPVYAHAFGSTAHRVIGHIAEKQLCPQAEEALSAALDGQSLGEAGLWADKIRGDKSYDYAKPWHYINIPDGVSITKAKRDPDGDVLWAIEEMNRRLDKEEPGSEAYAEALKFLIHFVADIHQPLHVGRQEDRGGNKIVVTYYTDFGKPPGRSNLHKYWDSDAIDMVVEDPAAHGDELIKANASRNFFSDPRRPERWVGEMMGLRPTVYGFTPPGEKDETTYLSRQYMTRAQEVLNIQMYLAGSRLGIMLNERYCVAKDAEKPAAEGS
jgi:hypothetical protein